MTIDLSTTPFHPIGMWIAENYATPRGECIEMLQGLKRIMPSFHGPRLCLEVFYAKGGFIS